MVTFYGHEAHSSLVEDGINSISYCGKFIQYLSEIQKEIKIKYHNNNFYPNYPTINIGVIKGGIAVNIIPRECAIEFEIRDTPEMDSTKIINKIKKYLKSLEFEMKKNFRNCRIKLEIKK